MTRRKWLLPTVGICGIAAVFAIWPRTNGAAWQPPGFGPFLEGLHPVSSTVAREAVVGMAERGTFLWGHYLVFDRSPQSLAQKLASKYQDTEVQMDPVDSTLYLKISWKTQGSTNWVGIRIDPIQIGGHQGCSIKYSTDPTWIEQKLDGLRRWLGVGS